MYELTRAQQWLYGKLTASPTVSALVEDRIYEAPAPQEVERDATTGRMLDYILIDHRAGTDITASNGTRIGSQLIFAIEIVTERSSHLALEPIYDAIDNALQAQRTTYRGMIIDMCQRDSNYADWGAESGTERRHVGGLWRLFVRPEQII